MKQSAWDLTPLFREDDDPAIAEDRRRVEEKSRAFISTWKTRSDYLEDPAALKTALDEYESWQGDCGVSGKGGYYFWLRTEQDENNPALKAKWNAVRDAGVAIRNDINFFELRLARIPAEAQKKFLADERLAPYRHFLERLFAEAAHLLSEAEEKILGLKEATSYENWEKMTSGFLSREERDVRLEDGTRAAVPFYKIASLMESRDKTVRDAAAAAFNGILVAHEDVAEAELNSLLADKKTNDELRGFPRPDAARHLADDMESETVDTLVGTVAAHFDIPRRYYELKAKLLGLPRLAYHERNVPYGDTDKTYSFEEALGLVSGVFRGLDPKFAAILAGFASHGQFDVYPKKGKKGGAFCAHELLSLPTYILMNYGGRLSDVITLAHEMGHAVNNEFMRERQNALNFGTPLSTAEVASTFMVDFVFEALAADAEEDRRLALMMAKLNDDVSTIFRQIACYRFEQELHAVFRRERYLSKEAIGALFAKHMAPYMGDAVEQPPESRRWWMHWSHIRAYFYVYTYASGLLISKSLQRSVRRDRAFIGNVQRFLAAGRSDSPRAIFQKCGINITEGRFWEEGIAETELLLDETIALARKLRKI